QRTDSFNAPQEKESAKQPVHLAIVYRADGTILGYRDGRPYGKPYSTKGPMMFEAGKSHVVFGMRHSPAGGNKMFRGKILQAQLYDRALQPEEIEASAASFSGHVTEAEVLAAIPADARTEYDRLRIDLERLQ